MNESRVPRWAVWTTFVLSLIGLAISTYLTITHFETQLLVCSGGGVIDCSLVTTSPQSYFLHVPVAILGLGQFIVLSVLNSPWGWRWNSRRVHLARFAIAAVGVGFVLWLIAAELVIINHICLWCTAVHFVTIALMLVLTRVSPQQLGWVSSNE